MHIPALQAELDQILADYTICVGRSHELHQIQDWVKSSSGGLRVVTALAGVGKTAFMRMLRDELGKEGFEVTAYFFRSMTKFDTLEVFQQFMPEEYLHAAQEEGCKRVIIIDAIEEAQQHLDTLRWNWTHLAKNVFVVFSLRASNDDKDLLDLPVGIRTVLRRDSPSVEAAQRITLGHLSNWEDVDSWVRQVLERQSQSPSKIRGFDGYVQSLREASDGWPLHIAFLLQDSGSGIRLANPSMRWDDYIATAWESLCLENKDRSHLLLPLIASAMRELHESELKQLWESIYPSDRSIDSLTSLPRAVRRWLQLRRNDSGYWVSFQHELLREKFRQTGTTFSAAYLRAREDLKSYASKNRKWDYAETYLPEHCLEDSDICLLAELFRDVDFQDRRCRTIGFARFQNFIQKAQRQLHASDDIFDEAALIVSSLADPIALSGLLPALTLAPSTSLGKEAQRAALESGKPWLSLAHGRELRPSLSRLVLPSGSPDRPVIASTSKMVVCGRWDGWLRVLRASADGAYHVSHEEWITSLNEQLEAQPSYSAILSIATVDEQIFTGHGDGTWMAWKEEENGAYRVVFRSAIQVSKSHEDVPAIFSLMVQDGRVITGDYNGFIRIWEPQEDGIFTEVGSIETKCGVFSLLHSDGALVSTHDDGSIRVFTAETEVSYEMSFGASGLGAVTAISLVGKIVSGHNDGSIRVWEQNVDGSYSIICQEETSSQVGSLVALDGKFASGHGDGRLRIWEFRDNGIVLSFQSEELALVCGLSYCQGRVITGHGDGSVRIWDADARGDSGVGLGSKVSVELYGTPKEPIMELNGQIISGHAEGFIHAWSVLPDGSLSLSFESAPVGVVQCLARHGQQFVSGHRDGIRVWEPQPDSTFRLCHQLDQSMMFPQGLASVDGRIVSGTVDRRMLVWEPTGETYKLAFESEEGKSIVCLAAINGSVFSGHVDGSIRSWSISDEISSSIIFKLGPRPANAKDATQAHRLEFVKDIAACAGRLVTAHDHGTLRVHELTGGGTYRTIFQADGLSEIETLTCMDGRIVSGHKDGCIRFWEATETESFEVVLTSPALQAVYDLAVVDGRLVSKHGDGSMLIWNLLTRPENDAVDTASNAVISSSALESIDTMLRRGEDHTLEFKSSVIWNIRDDRYDVVMRAEVLKEICAFLNADGGTILCGVNDEGVVIGLQRDIKHTSSRDKLGLALTSTFGDLLRPNPVELVSLKFIESGGDVVLRIDVRADHRTRYESPSTKKEDIGKNLARTHVRIHGSVRALEGQDLINWSNRRFGRP